MAENNVDLTQTYTEEKQAKIKVLQAKLEDEIETTWYGKPKTELDQTKKEQAEILDDLAKKNLEELSLTDQEKILNVLELEEVLDVFEENGAKKESVPSLQKAEIETHFEPKAAPYTMLIPENSGSGIILEVKNDQNLDLLKENATLSFSQVASNQVQGIVEDNKILYKGIYENTDLLTTSTPQGVKEDLILKKPSEGTYPTIREDGLVKSGYQGDETWFFDYKLDLEGLTVEEFNNGLKFLDENGQEVFYTPAPFMLDGKGKRSEKVKFKIIEASDLNLI